MAVSGTTIDQDIDIWETVRKAMEADQQNNPSTHWHIEYNLPGCLPEMDPIVAFTVEDAINTLRDLEEELEEDGNPAGYVLDYQDCTDSGPDCTTPE